MHRTEGANNQAGMFKDSPPATLVEQNWLNSVQEEVANVIEEAGHTLLTQATDTKTQLYEAILAHIANYTITPQGFLQRAQFLHDSGTRIKINPGYYHILGSDVVNKTIFWHSQLVWDVGPGGSNPSSEAVPVSAVYYIYLDDSAIQLLGTNEITAAQIIGKATAPAWNDAKHGWYDGTDRCIFAISTDGAAALEEFAHDGGNYVVMDGLDVTPNTCNLSAVIYTVISATATTPTFVRKIEVCINYSYVDADSTLLLGYFASAGPDRINAYLMRVDNTQEYNSSTVSIIISPAPVQEFELMNSAGTNSIAIYVHGWYFPIGM